MIRLFFTLSLCAALHAQSFEGTVYDAHSGAPLPGVRVAAAVSGQSITTLTDSAGRFRLAVAASSPFGATFHRAGYLMRNDFIPAGPAPTVGWRIPLLPSARLTGRLADADGLAVGDVEVSALRLVLIQGRREWASAASTRTDDLGRFRIAGLPAGRYRLQARPRLFSDIARWDARYATTYYPAVTDAAQARLVEVTTGQQVDGLNFQLVRLEGVTVSGRLVMPAGVRLPGPLQLMSEETAGFGRSFTSVTSSNTADGTFLIRHVPPGPLNLRVQSNALPGQSPPFSGSTHLQVANSDIRDVQLEILASTPFDLPGRITINGRAPGVPLRIALRSNSANAQHQAESDAAGAILFKGLVPNDYSLASVSTLNQSAAPQIHVTAARFAGQVLTNYGAHFKPGANASLEIDVAELNARLTVEVKDAAGLPLPLAFVQLLDEKTQLLYGSGSAPQGQRRLTVPAGLYRVVLWPESARMQDVSDAAYIDAHKNDFPPVQLNAGDNPPLALKMPVR